MRKLAPYLLLLSVFGCSSATDYYPETPSGSDGVAVNPDRYKIDGSQYPIFHTRKSIDAPAGETYWLAGAEYLAMTPILPTDSWRVTHTYKGLLIIQSEEYNDRQCRYLDQIGRNPVGGGVNILGYCLQAFEYGIYVDEQGAITGGWELLPGKQKIFSARNMFLSPDEQGTSLWPEEVIFFAD